MENGPLMQVLSESIGWGNKWSSELGSPSNEPQDLHVHQYSHISATLD